VRLAIDTGELTTVWVNSPGGDVTAALALYDMLSGRVVMVITTGQCEIANNPSAPLCAPASALSCVHCGQRCIVDLLLRGFVGGICYP
jgi:ClpP protease-like protein